MKILFHKYQIQRGMTNYRVINNKDCQSIVEIAKLNFNLKLEDEITLIPIASKNTQIIMALHIGPICQGMWVFGEALSAYFFLVKNVAKLMKPIKKITRRTTGARGCKFLQVMNTF